MAMHDIIMHFATDLDNGITFDVYVDHQALVYLVTAPATTANRRIMTYILDLQGFTFNVIFTKGSAHLDADALSRLFRFTDSVDELTVPLPSFGDVQDENLRNLLALQEQHPETMKQASQLINNMCTDFDYLDYTPDPRLLFPNHEDTVLAQPADSLPDRDHDKDSPPLGSPPAVANTVSITTPQRLPNSCTVPIPSPFGTVRDIASPQGSRIISTNTTPVPSYVEYDSTITTPTFVKYISFPNNVIHMELINRYTGATSYRPLPVSADSEERQSLCHSGQLDFDIASTHLYANSNDSDYDSDSAIAHAGNYSFRTNRRQTKRADTNTTLTTTHRIPRKGRLKRAGQTPTITADQRTFITTTSDRNQRRGTPYPTQAPAPILPVVADEPSAPDNPVANAVPPPLSLEEQRLQKQQRLKANRLRRNALRLEAQQSKGPQILQPVTARQFEDHRTSNHNLARRYQHLVGQHYAHPGTHRVYEVVHVYFDVAARCVACYRRPADGEPSEAEDAYPVKVEGATGVNKLAQLYAANSGIMTSTVVWPRSEEAMLQLQREDPALSAIFSSIDADSTVPIYHRPTNPQHYGYQYILNPNSALRVQQLKRDGSSINPSSPVLIVIPSVLQPAALRFLHEGMAHIGAQRMSACMATRYWWVGISTDVKAYNNNCRTTLPHYPTTIRMGTLRSHGGSSQDL